MPDPSPSPSGRFILYQPRLSNGEQITLRLLPDGRWVCPVCGAVFGGPPPYHRDEFDERGRRRPDVTPAAWANGSMDICPECWTQYGYSDFFADFPGLSQEEIWAHLRRGYLDAKGWRPEDLRRIRDNLGIDRPQRP